ncbi:MAG: hypothetical protein KA740_13105 [Rhodoferax sp.]|nr:hypothetical protein [Rhodoferax sp.]
MQLMHTHRTPDVALWDHYRALREQWTHEDNLVNQRMGWLIWSEGLMFTAYAAQSREGLNWLVMGFPLFGILVAFLAGVGVYTAMAATDDIKQQFDQAGLNDLCPLAPASHISHRGRWAAKSLPFVFGALWLLALLSSLRH